jgi:hypothetical protein
MFHVEQKRLNARARKKRKRTASKKYGGFEWLKVFHVEHFR